MLEFSVSNQCQGLGLRAGAIVFRDLCVDSSSAELRQQIVTTAERLAQCYQDVATIGRLPEMQEFQAIHRRVGANPRKHPSSVQSLLQYGLKRKTLPNVNNLVDTYNLLSVSTLLSIGAHDTDRLEMPVELRILKGDEPFTPLGSATRAALAGGQFAYVDSRDRVICRLDVQQAEFSKVTTSTRNVLLIIEGNLMHRREDFEHAFAHASESIRRHCGGKEQTVYFPELD